LPKYLPSSFPGCEFVNGVIKINKSQFNISTQRILRSHSRSCDIVKRSTLLILFSFENNLLPKQFVTIKHKNNLKIVSTFGKTAWIFSCLIIWYNVNKFDSPDTEGGVGKGAKSVS